MDDFVIGLLGALAPESWRLYNLRNQPQVPWSWRYLVFTIPFLGMGGAIAYVLEPSTKWGAFYAGLTAPILLTTVMKDTAKAQQEYEAIAQELAAEKQRQSQLKMENQALLQRLAAVTPDSLPGSRAEPSSGDTGPIPPAVPTQPLSEGTRPPRAKWPSRGILLVGGVLAGGLAVALSQPLWQRLDSTRLPPQAVPGEGDILLSYQPRVVGPALLLLGLGLGGLAYYRYRQRRRPVDQPRRSILDRFLGGIP